jgi:AcrR family transcriptional regulator
LGRIDYAGLVTSTGPPLSPPASLRERKKQRTRRALADTAVEVFMEQGFDSTPLDALLERVEVSRRTFFRHYRSKEDVALTAVKELWNTFLEVLDEREQSGRLVEVFRGALLTTLDRMDDTWHSRFAATLQLIEDSPALNGHSLRHCDDIQGLIKERLATPDTLQLRLALEFCVAAWRGAYGQWLPEARPAGLPRHVRHAFDSMGDALDTEI